MITLLDMRTVTSNPEQEWRQRAAPLCEESFSDVVILGTPESPAWQAHQHLQMCDASLVKLHTNLAYVTDLVQ